MFFGKLMETMLYTFIILLQFFSNFALDIIMIDDI